MIVWSFKGMLCMLFLSVIFNPVFGNEDGREIEQNLRLMTPENARGYLMPLMESYSASTLRSTYHSADIEKGFNLYLGMKAMMAFIPHENKTFFADPPGAESSKQTATVVGDKGNDAFPNGFKWNIVPVMIPHLQVGSILGTEFSVRYLPSTKFDDKIGDFNVLGGGITHSLSQYLPEITVQFSIQGFYVQTKLGNIFESTGTAYNFLTSTNIAGLTLYGGVGYEITDMEVQYDYDPENEEQTPTGSPQQTTISFTESFEEQFRATVGMSLQFIIFNLNADYYSFGDYHVVTVGLGISI